MRVKLNATEGMIYTNGEIYGRTIFLGSGDSPDNWHEIPLAEYDERKKEVLRHEKNLYQPRTFR